MTPCESTPRRLAQTIASAQVAAMARSTPAAARIAAAKSVRLFLVMRISSGMCVLSGEASPTLPLVGGEGGERSDPGGGLYLLRARVGPAPLTPPRQALRVRGERNREDSRWGGLPRRNLDQFRQLLLIERRGRVLEIDGVAHDHVEPDDPVGVEARLRKEPLAAALRLVDRDAEPVGIDLEGGRVGVVAPFDGLPHAPHQPLA